MATSRGLRTHVARRYTHGGADIHILIGVEHAMPSEDSMHEINRNTAPVIYMPSMAVATIISPSINAPNRSQQFQFSRPALIEQFFFFFAIYKHSVPIISYFVQTNESIAISHAHCFRVEIIIFSKTQKKPYPIHTWWCCEVQVTVCSRRDYAWKLLHVRILCGTRNSLMWRPFVACIHSFHRTVQQKEKKNI